MRFARRTDWRLAGNRLANAIDAVRKKGGGFLDLTRSNPTECGLRYQSEQILQALNVPVSLRYEPSPRGIVSARAAVAAYYRDRGDKAPGLDQIFLTTSTSEAYSYVFRLLCEPGDRVLAPVPSYPLFQFLADIQDVSLQHYHLFYDHGWHIDFSSLEEQITAQTRAIVVVHPNNPTGSFVSIFDTQRLVELCRERELALISDEVFLDYTLDANTARSFVSWSDALTFSLSGLSKISCLPQMKVAWLAVTGPPPLREEACRRLEVIADTYLSLNGPMQHALPSLLQQRHGIQAELMQRIAGNLSVLHQMLGQGSAVQALEVQGGWYGVLRVPVTASDEDLAIALLERAGVLVHPGHFYDFPQDGFLVLSLITPPEEFRAGASRLIEFLDRAA